MGPPTDLHPGIVEHHAPNAVFAPERAQSRTIEIRCDELIDLLAVTHAADRIDAYRARMRAGDRFPPVGVVRLAGRYWLADGHKRFAAYRGLAFERILVEVWSPRRWLRDQARQARDNAGKNARILRLSVSDPAAAWRLLLTTVLHWRRVAISLARRATGRIR